MTDEKKKPEEELNEEELEDVSGGATMFTGSGDGTVEAGAIPDVLQTPSPGGSFAPIPYPNTAGGDVSHGDVPKKDSPMDIPDSSK